MDHPYVNLKLFVVLCFGLAEGSILPRTHQSCLAHCWKDSKPAACFGALKGQQIQTSTFRRQEIHLDAPKFLTWDIFVDSFPRKKGVPVHGTLPWRSLSMQVLLKARPTTSMASEGILSDDSQLQLPTSGLVNTELVFSSEQHRVVFGCFWCINPTNTVDTLGLELLKWEDCWVGFRDWLLQQALKSLHLNCAQLGSLVGLR